MAAGTGLVCLQEQGWETLLYRTVALQEQGWTPMVEMHYSQTGLTYSTKVPNNSGGNQDVPNSM